MRLLRGSGVDGLAAMLPRNHVPDDRGGWWLIRPLLCETRADLRHFADTLHLPYAEDPSNEDPRYDRVRMRQAMAMLGLGSAGLAHTADRMARAAEALRARASDVGCRIVKREVVNGVQTGDLLIDRDDFAALERDTQMRLLADGLCWVASAQYRPRARALEALLDRALAGGGGTLHGVEVFVARRQIRLAREFAAVEALAVPAAPEAVWDTRWRLGTDIEPGLTLRALGPGGWAQRAESASISVPARATYSWPALFIGERLMACPPLRVGPAGTIRLCDSLA
jgi:tRNA(Ile)-lysidine synthase